MAALRCVQVHGAVADLSGMTQQGYGANGLPHAGGAGDSGARQPAGGGSGRAAASGAVELPRATYVWLGVSSVVVLAMMVGMVLADPLIIGGTEPAGDDSLWQLVTILGLGLAGIGFAFSRAFAPWLATVREVVARSVVVPAEVVAVRGSQRVGGKATVSFGGQDGTPQTRELLAVGRYTVGQPLTVRYDPVNPAWAVVERPDPAGIDGLSKLPVFSWLLAGSGLLLAVFGIVELV